MYGYHWPSFNLADSSVVVGTILLFISVIKYI
ncbi:MAG: signal peptidase II [Deltaproteobacteria bacterium]|nr:signal peptidase II [Deltaproteobacteria bacterium]